MLRFLEQSRIPDCLIDMPYADPEKARACKRLFHHRHKGDPAYMQKMRDKSAKYRAEHPPEIFGEKLKRWRKKNPEKARGWAREYNTRRYREDPAFRMTVLLRGRLVAALNGQTKSRRTLELLGCTIPKLLAHLERQFRPGMTWENQGPVWHVDHVKPCAKFDLTDPAQQSACFHYTNLQPLFAEENRKKKDSYAGV